MFGNANPRLRTKLSLWRHYHGQAIGARPGPKVVIAASYPKQSLTARTEDAPRAVDCKRCLSLIVQMRLRMLRAGPATDKSASYPVAVVVDRDEVVLDCEF